MLLYTSFVGDDIWNWQISNQCCTLLLRRRTRNANNVSCRRNRQIHKTWIGNLPNLYHMNDCRLEMNERFYLTSLLLLQTSTGQKNCSNWTLDSNFKALKDCISDIQNPSLDPILRNVSSDIVPSRKLCQAFSLIRIYQVKYPEFHFRCMLKTSPLQNCIVLPRM